MPQTKERVKRRVKKALKRTVSPEVAQDILEELADTAEDSLIDEEGALVRMPGKVVGGTKTTWTYQDLVKMFPIVTFLPDETILLTFNGVSVQAIANLEMHVPKCFLDIFQRHKRELQSSGKALPERGYISEIGLGLGALPPEQYRNV